MLTSKLWLEQQPGNCFSVLAELPLPAQVCQPQLKFVPHPCAVQTAPAGAPKTTEELTYVSE